MKTGNTLRTAKNSLLCFFMALAGGFLVACGSDDNGGYSPIVRSAPTPPTPSDVLNTSFNTYLLDTAVEGVEYSGPTGDGMTGKGGVFPALVSEEPFVFSIGATTLGTIVVSSDQEGNEVTPSDFMGVDAETVISIARIMQGLDEDGMLQNGISISQNTREFAPDLFAVINSDGQMATGPIGGKDFMIPPKATAEAHLVATRQCLFSGGYVGDYLANGETGGTAYYAIDLFAADNHAKRFGFADAGGTVNALGSFNATLATVGVIGNNISDGLGNALSFITPRLAMGEWEDRGAATVSGTHTALVAVGNPGATRRIVGVQTTDDTDTAAGMYVLDYFANDNEANGGSFSGQYYDVNDEGTAVLVSTITLTIAADGGSWSSVAVSGSTATLTLIGSDMTITTEIARTSDYHGSFNGVGNELSGTWCDIGGAVGSATPPTPPTPTPPTPSAPRVSVQNTLTIEITWSPVQMASVYNLYRSTVSAGTVTTVITVNAKGSDTLTVTDSRPSADTEYFYQLQACNSNGCSNRSQEANTLPPPDVPAITLRPSGSGDIDVRWSEVQMATVYNFYRSEGDNTSYVQIFSTPLLAYNDNGLTPDTRYYYQSEACNSNGCSERSVEMGATTFTAVPSNQDDVCVRGATIAAGQSCTWRDEIVFMVGSDGTAMLGNRAYNGEILIGETVPIGDGTTTQLSFIATQNSDNPNGWVIDILA